MRDHVYNVGDESMNYTKEDIALKIRERVDFYLHFAEIGKDEDQRDYEVSYDRIRATGFKAEISMDEGIDELLRAMAAIEIQSEYSNV
jgi:nucleoside-diphosphate-sugar epimerase